MIFPNNNVKVTFIKLIDKVRFISMGFIAQEFDTWYIRVSHILKSANVYIHYYKSSYVINKLSKKKYLRNVCFAFGIYAKQITKVREEID